MPALCYSVVTNGGHILKMEAGIAQATASYNMQKHDFALRFRCKSVENWTHLSSEKQQEKYGNSDVIIS